MKEALSAIAGKFGIWRLTSRFIPVLRGRKLLAVFTFHRIAANPNDPRYLARYDRGSASGEFRVQLEAIRQIFRIVNLEEFQRLTTGTSPLNAHSALLTFDDADSEFYTEAFPILTAQKLPAVMFAPTSYIGSDKVFWHLRISNAFYHITEDQWQCAKQELSFLQSPDDKRVLHSTVDSPENRRRACQLTIWLLDRVDEEQAIMAAKSLESLVGCDYSLGIRCMNWNQLADLQVNGVSVESHTVNHPKLTRIGEHEVKQELEESKLQIEERLNKKVTAVCYPGGHFDDRILEAAGQAGYKLGFVTRFGFCRPSMPDSRPLALPRFDMRGSSGSLAERYLTKLVLKF